MGCIKERVLSLDSHRILRFTLGFIEHPSKNQALNVSNPPPSKLLKSNGLLADLDTKNGLHRCFSLKKKQPPCEPTVVPDLKDLGSFASLALSLGMGILAEVDGTISPKEWFHFSKISPTSKLVVGCCRG